ncbi:MAG: ATP-dependent RNA helicase HrpA [Pseudomonadales bacterium]
MSTTIPPEIAQQITEQIDYCMLKDRYRLRRQLRELTEPQKQRGGKGKPCTLAELEQAVGVSAALAEKRAANTPKIAFPDNLPVSQKREEIAAAIAKNQVVVIAGETGSGKTTQIPKICLDLGRGIHGMIGHTQPRRLAARSVATRIAEELKVKLGEQLGFQVRFTDQVTETTLIKLMTDGILLAETQNDPYLNKYDTLIIDEAHERSLNIDFLLGYLKQLLPKRPELKVIITSATIDLARFSKHFDDAPVIEVSGRTFPVELIYQPPIESEETKVEGIGAAIVEAVETIRAMPRRSGPNDILIFLSGEQDIREVSKLLNDQHYANTEVMPLYARLSASEQNRVFQPHRGQRIVLATNVAETSVTVPGIRYVIDPGFARISRYSARSKVQRLPIESISQASANQRKGRCGRVAEGVCIRLYEEEDFNNRPEFTDAEILRTNLASVILQMISLRLGDISRFPFIDAPDNRSIKDGYQLLTELGAVNDKRQITRIGKQLVRFPVDPRIARMLIAANENGCLTEVLIIASALTIQDPRERPLDKQQAADEKHQAYVHEDSDFLSFVNLWNSAEAQRQAMSTNQFRKYCKKYFLNFLRIREWRDLHRQLLLVCKDMKFSLNSEPAEYEAVHQALMTGLLGNLGEKQDQKDYKGARNRQFYIFPGSGQFKRSPKWLMSAEMVETSKLYARINAKIDPVWVEPLAKHLVKRSHSEPHWEKKRGQVLALEQVSLYGLVIVNRRRVDFGRIDPVLAREIFIREALVPLELISRAAFIRHNRALLADIEALEHKSRRRDILVDEQVLYAFYDERLPAGIYTRVDLEQWLKSEPANDKSLRVTRDYLMQHSASHVSESQFPDAFLWPGMRLKLDYQFEPGKDQDGVSISVPLGLLNQLPAYRLQWLVPGMLADKCVALVKALPKNLRKHFVPVPDVVGKALAQMAPENVPLTESLGHALKRLTGIEIPGGSWDETRLEPHHHFNIRVLDEAGRVVVQDRDLHRLRQRFSQQVNESLQSVTQHAEERSGITQWDFGELGKTVDVHQAGMKLKAYPAIEDAGDSVSLVLADTAERAQQISAGGILRLLMLANAQQVKYLQKNLPKLDKTLLYFSKLGDKKTLVDDLLKAAFQQTFLESGGPQPANANAFKACIETHRAELVTNATKMAEQLNQMAETYHQITKKLNGQVPLPWMPVYAEIKTQLERLFCKHFLARVGWPHLQHYPRYLKAIEQRMDKLQGQLAKERIWCAELEQFWQKYETLRQKLAAQGLDTTPAEQFRWMIEEYRVSVYAQQLGTPEPVSAKRLQKKLEDIKA